MDQFFRQLNSTYENQGPNKLNLKEVHILINLNLKDLVLSLSLYIYTYIYIYIFQINGWIHKL